MQAYLSVIWWHIYVICRPICTVTQNFYKINKNNCALWQCFSNLDQIKKISFHEIIFIKIQINVLHFQNFMNNANCRCNNIVLL